MELEQPIKNGDKEDDNSYIDNDTGVGNSDDAEQQDKASEDNDTKRGPEAHGTQVEPPPTGTSVCEVLSPSA